MGANEMSDQYKRARDLIRELGYDYVEHEPEPNIDGDLVIAYIATPVKPMFADGTKALTLGHGALKNDLRGLHKARYAVWEACKRAPISG
jgi:hypothetical protein